jgi:AcrR family transcriptional regulator
VAAALAIVDAGGADALSIRRLAQSIGVTPMAVYWHVRNKAELLDLVGQAVLDTMVLPRPTGDWREDLRALHRAMLEGFLAHPGTADLMVGRARYGASGIRMFERFLDILLSAGLPPAAAFDAYQTLYQWLLGYIAAARRSPAFRAAQLEGLGYLRSLDPADFPSIASVAPEIGRRPPIEAFEVGLDIVIEGIAAGIAHRRPSIPGSG